MNKPSYRKTGDIHENCEGHFIQFLRDVNDGYMKCDKCRLIQFATKEEKESMEINILK